MKTIEKQGVMSSLGNRKGFSLVEMAVVLVIIGLIIGAIVKGQDLILNARAKQVTSAISTWRNLALAYLDRNGRYPGDGLKDGIIGSGVENDAASAATSEISSTMQFAPANPITVGSFSFYAYFGNVPGEPNGATSTRNVIVICNTAACDTIFTKDELEVIKAVDTAMDGSADAGLGTFRGATAIDGTPATTNVVTGGTTLGQIANGGGTTAQWVTGNNYKAAVWSFDRPF